MNIQKSLKYFILLVATANLVACGATKVDSGSNNFGSDNPRDLPPPPSPDDPNPLDGYDQRLTSCTLINADRNNIGLRADARTVIGSYVDTCTQQAIHGQEDPNLLAVSIDDINNVRVNSDMLINFVGWSEDTGIRNYSSNLGFALQQRGTGQYLTDSDSNNTFKYLDKDKMQDIIDHNYLGHVTTANFFNHVLIILSDSLLGHRADNGCGSYSLKAVSLRMIDQTDQSEVGHADFLIPTFYIDPTTYGVVKANEPNLQMTHPLFNNSAGVNNYLYETQSRCL